MDYSLLYCSIREPIEGESYRKMEYENPMSQEKRVTVEEAFRGCSTHYCNHCYLWGTPINIREKQCGNCNQFSLVNLEEFILSFAAKEAEPLVEALRRIAEDSDEGVVCENVTIAQEALTAHRAKYPRKP